MIYSFVYAQYIKLRYNTKNNISVAGRVYLDAQNITFGKNVYLDANVHIFGGGKVILGDNVALGDGVVICSAEKIEIKADTSVAAHSYIIDCNHGMLRNEIMRTQALNIKPVTIGRDVWIAAGCMIIAGAQIGDGAVIGAGTVVDRKIEEYTINISDRNISARKRKYASENSKV
ncbi:MAG: acyltransferase [Oscillospiraceae bacterium]